MLKKKTRNVRFLKITLTHKRKNSKEIPRTLKQLINDNDPLKECLCQLASKLNASQESLIHKTQQEQICRALRRLSFDGSCVTMLWGTGDKGTADPCFWNDVTDEVREEQAGDKERVSCSGHMVISLNYMQQLDGYMACVEDVPGLSTTALANALNSFLGQHVQIILETEEKKNINQTVRVNMDILASRDFDEAMRGRTPLALIAETIADRSEFDEFFAMKEKKTLVFKAEANTPLKEFKNIFSFLRKKKPEYKKYTVKYRENNRAERSMSIESREQDNNDLDSYLFIQRDTISLDTDIKQFCNEVHEELARKMKNLLLAEQRYLNENSR